MSQYAAKLARRIRKERNKSVVHLSEYKKIRREAEAAVAALESGREITKNIHPVHACYMQALNYLSYITENLLASCDELIRFNNTIVDIQENYHPEGPPMSPITFSFFMSWSTFDLSFGLKKETLTSIVIAVSHLLGIQPDLVSIFKILDRSRMGLYEHMGFHENWIKLKECVTNEVFHIHNTSGYRGEVGELWYVRLLPSLHPEMPESIAFTTPYVLTTDRNDWAAFLKRTLSKMTQQKMDYASFMKHGLNQRYWLEYIFQAYGGVRSDGSCIYLTGLPDIGKSRPHFSDFVKYLNILPEWDQTTSKTPEQPLITY